MRRQTLVRGLAALSMAPWTVGARAQGERLRIGLTAVILADQTAFLARWADYLSERLKARVGFVTRDEYQPLHDMLGNGQVDALWTCGYPYVRFQSQLRLLAVPLYQGQPTYQSYLIRSAGDTSIRGWADLRGKVFAYSDPLSNSGWLVAQGQFAAAGVAPRELRRAFFAHGHRNVAEAVAAGLANAGSIDGYVWETMKRQGMGAVAQTEVIWKSPWHGFPPIVAPLGAGHLRIDALQRSLLEMHRDEAGQALLGALNLDGFMAGSPGLFDSIRRLAQSVPGSGVAAS
jgi:phosphonate transport system substrate-binding protein